MENLIHADVFFFISSIGFIIIGIFVIIIMIKIINIMTIFSRIIKKVEKDINTIGDVTKEIVEEMRSSLLYRLLFSGRKKIHKKSKK